MNAGPHPALVAGRRQLREHLVDGIDLAGDATHADDVALVAGPGGVGVALNGDATGVLAADIGVELRNVVSLLVSDSLPVLGIGLVEHVVEAFTEAAMLEIDP